ncbi:MAG: phosphatidylserine decarboxylase family protein [Acidobacteriaceae bacterium]
MVRDGYFYGLGLAVVAALLWYVTQAWWAAIPALLLAAFFLWFFRDPEREIPQGEGVMVSPADGVVSSVDWIQTVGGPRARVSIFMNVFNVHVNRTPIAGEVMSVVHRPGKFLNAMNPDSVQYNEQNMIVIAGDGCEISMKQIAGLLARRIVCNLRVGDKLCRGERIGMIKFGSRVDVLLPGEIELKVEAGDKVQGGSTVLAVMTGRANG